MSRSKKSYEDGSMVDLAVKGLNQIQGFLEDDRPQEKLLALNSILVFIILGLIISSYLNVNFNDFSGIVILAVSFLFSAIISGAYIFVIKTVSKAYKTKAVRVSIFILFLALPICVFGITYQLKQLINLAFLLILIQVIVMVILSLFIEEENVSKEKSNLWKVLGRTGTILGIISSLIAIAEFSFKFLA